jgi:hypothetical protein
VRFDFIFEPHLAMEIAQAIGEELKKVFGTLGKHYVKCMIANAFKPALEEGIAGLLDDAKAALGKAEEAVEDGLPEDPQEKEKDTFIFEVDSVARRENSYGKRFLTYHTFVIRIGSEGDEKERKFYCNANQYHVRYPVLRRAPELALKDFKDFKAPAFPAPYDFGGTCCFCISKASGDIHAHRQQMHDYFSELFNHIPGYSEKLASHFKVGGNYKAAQATYAVLLDAVAGATEELGLTSVRTEVDPFTMKELVVEFLQSYANTKLSEIDAAIPGDNAVSIAGRNAAHNLVLSAIESAASPFDTVMEKAQQGAEKVTEKLQEKAGEIVESLKPVIARVVGLIKEKMGDDEKDEKKEEEEKEEKKKGPQIGDIAIKWRVNATDIGKRLDAALDGKSKPSDAIKNATSDFTEKLTTAVRGPLDAMVKSMDLKGSRFVVRQVNRLVDKITNFILEVTTLDGFIEASHKIALVVDEAEDKLKAAAGDEGKVKAAIDDISACLWQKGSAAIALELFKRIWKLEEKIKSALSGLPEEGVAPLLDLLNHIFEVQLRAFNGIRVQYVRNLKESAAEIKDGDSAVATSRAAFKGALFPVLNLLAYHHWIKAHEALLESAKITVVYFFLTEAWPSVKSALDAIAIPDICKDLGLEIEPMARGLAKMLIVALVKFIMKKVFLLLEKALFAQEEY